MSPNDSNGSNSAFREPDKTRNPSYCIHGVQDDSKDNKKWCGVVTSRPALDAALVLDNQTTHEDHFSCDRDGKPTCSQDRPRFFDFALGAWQAQQDGSATRGARPHSTSATAGLRGAT